MLFKNAIKDLKVILHFDYVSIYCNLIYVLMNSNFLYSVKNSLTDEVAN